MKLILFVICFVSGFTLISQSLPLGWAGSFHAACFEPHLTTDSQGNTYITGTFQSTIDLDPGPGTFTFSPLNGSDIFICKLNAAGHFVWGKRISSAAGEEPTAITLDNQSNVLITGWFQYTMDFDPGPAVYTLTSAWSEDIFVLKLDSSGNFVWARNMGGNGTDFGTEITTDNNGNVYTTGIFESIADFNPGPGKDTLCGDSFFYPIFLSKLNSQGNYVWAKMICQSNGFKPLGLALDKHGNVYTSGNFQGSSDFNPGNAVYNLNAVGIEIFVSKLDSLGNFIYAELIGQDGLATPFDLTTDSLDNLYLAGDFKWTPDFDPGPATYTATPIGGTDMFLQKIDPNGNFVWFKQIGDVGDDRVQSIYLFDSHLYSTGYYAGNPDFDPGPSVVTHTAYSKSAFINKFDLNGSYIWSIGFSSYLMSGNSISLDGYGNIYTCGYFENTTDFDPTAATYSITAPSSGDTYVCKLGTTVAGLQKNTIDDEISFYPNPGQNDLFIKRHFLNEKVAVEITSLQGQILMKKLLAEDEDAFNIGTLPEGCYIISMKGETFNRNFRLIKQ